MANYYNVVGWKHTGFDFYNRPFSRDVLNTDYFTNSNNYFQMKGIAVKRDDSGDISYIDLPGSVKDLRGDQVNSPNSVGTHGPGGPWYSLEEVDYIRLARTGYPGDPDYVDITGHEKDPWNAPREGKMWVSYYFVTGLQPMARNVTRVFLMLDEWTTMGGADELEIETGFKIRGPISDAEDASSYNLAPEPISLIEPLKTISNTPLNDVPVEAGEKVDFLVSAIDLTQYSEEQTISAFVAQAANGETMAFPAIAAVSRVTQMQLNDLDGTKNFYANGYALFDPKDSRVQHNLSVLYSAGQLELQDSYSIPKQYVLAAPQGGIFSDVANTQQEATKTWGKDISGYPRKADYLFGKECLYSLATGAMNVQSFSELTNDNVQIWAVICPSGYPVARFKGISDHPFLYDQTVSGMPWLKTAVIMQGASGSMWTQVQNAFAQQTQNRAASENEFSNEIWDYRFAGDTVKTAADAAIGAGSAVSSGFSVTNALSGGKETWQAAQAAADTAYAGYNLYMDYKSEMGQRQFREASLAQAQNQLNAGMAQAGFKAPLVNFIPDVSLSAFQENAFAVAVINTGAKDRQRLKNYFNRYGYSGQYVPLTWDVVNIKSKVNYIQCEAVCLKHAHFPTRMTMKTAALLSQGLFLWNEKPNQAAFANNPDK